MRPLRILAVSIGTLTLSMGAAYCAGTAIVLDDFPSPDEIGPLVEPELQMEWPGLADVLKRHGVEIIRPDATSAIEMGMQLAELSAKIDPDSPLLIVANASLIEDSPSGWLFFGPGTEIFDNQLADRALNANVIADIARAREAPVVLVIATDVAHARVDSVFDKSAANFPENMTYAVVSPDFAPEFLDKGVLQEGASFASLEAALPLKGSIAGALPEENGFLGPVSPEVVSTLAYDKGIWSALATINNPDAVEQYLALQPNGAHIDEARARLYMLQYNSDGVAAEDEAALNLTEDQRFQIQDSLDYLGLYIGVIDGNWEEDTREAIRNWQLWSKFPVTGYVNAKQLATLRQQVEMQEEKDRQIALDEEREEREYWLATGQRGSEQELRAYLARYPAGTFADIAHQRLDILADAITSQRSGGSGNASAAGKAPDRSSRSPKVADDAEKSEPAKKTAKAEESDPEKSTDQATASTDDGSGSSPPSTFLGRVFWQKDLDELENKGENIEAAPAPKKAAPAKAAPAKQAVAKPAPAPVTAKPRVAQPAARPAPQRVVVPVPKSAQPAKQPTQAVKSTTRSEPAESKGIGQRIKGLFTGRKRPKTLVIKEKPPASAAQAPKVRSRAEPQVAKPDSFKILNAPEVPPPAGYKGKSIEKR